MEWLLIAVVAGVAAATRLYRPFYLHNQRLKLHQAFKTIYLPKNFGHRPIKRMSFATYTCCFVLLAILIVVPIFCFNKFKDPHWYYLIPLIAILLMIRLREFNTEQAVIEFLEEQGYQVIDYALCAEDVDETQKYMIYRYKSIVQDSQGQRWVGIVSWFSETFDKKDRFEFKIDSRFEG